MTHRAQLSVSPQEYPSYTNIVRNVTKVQVILSAFQGSSFGMSCPEKQVEELDFSSGGVTAFRWQ